MTGTSPFALRARQVLGGPECPNAGPLHILTTLILLSYGDKDGLNMRPAHSTLVAETSSSLATMKRILRDLEAWHIVFASQRVDRQPVIWEVGSLLKEPPKGHVLALEEKKRIIKAREDNKPAPNPQKTIARAYKSIQKHKHPSLYRKNDDIEADVMVIPNEIGEVIEEVLNGDREKWPEQWPRDIGLDAITVTPTKYAPLHATKDDE